MEHHILSEAIEAVIMDGNLDEAINLFIKYAKSKEVVSISSRLRKLNKEIRSGIISREQHTIEHNQIRDVLLTLCYQLKEGTLFPNQERSTLNEETTRLSGTSHVLTSVKTLTMDIKIDRDFSSYSDSDKEKLLGAIRNILELNGEVKVLQMREGSVILTLELTPEQCEKLHWAIKSGRLSDFDVIDSEIIKTNTEAINEKNDISGNNSEKRETLSLRFGKSYINKAIAAKQNLMLLSTEPKDTLLTEFGIIRGAAVVAIAGVDMTQNTENDEKTTKSSEGEEKKRKKTKNKD